MRTIFVVSIGTVLCFKDLSWDLGFNLLLWTAFCRKLKVIARVYQNYSKKTSSHAAKASCGQVLEQRAQAVSISCPQDESVMCQPSKIKDMQLACLSKLG
jgi:predicted RNA-binding Zn-ribbon protein involved in translation (DUF1610 family)